MRQRRQKRKMKRTKKLRRGKNKKFIVFQSHAKYNSIVMVLIIVQSVPVPEPSMCFISDKQKKVEASNFFFFLLVL